MNITKCISLSWIIHKNAPVISGKIYVACKRKMLHDIGLHMTSLVDTKHVLTERLIYLWHIEFCIWLRPRTVHVMHAHFARYEIIGSRPSTARFTRIISHISWTSVYRFCFFLLSGFQVVVAVQFCSFEPDFLRLLTRFSFLGATPTKPELAFTMDLMKLLLTLNLECQVAVKEFCSAIQTLVNDIISFPALRKFKNYEILFSFAFKNCHIVYPVSASILYFLLAS